MPTWLHRTDAAGRANDRRREPAPGTSAAAALPMQAGCLPRVRHVVEFVSDRVERRRDDQGEDSGPRGARS